MAPLMSRFWVHLFIFVYMVMPGMAAAFNPDNPAPWRPSILPDMVLSNETENIRQMSKGLTHKQTDADTLVAISLALPDTEATTILKQCFSASGKKMSETDLSWAQLVYCFGVVHTDEAKQFLLNLWEQYDEAMASNDIEYPFSSVGVLVNPLGVIGDALRLYFDDPSLRLWVQSQMTNSLSMNASVSSSFNTVYRKGAREHLVVALYSWRIIDSWAGTQDITQGYFYLSPKVTDYSRAAKAVADIAHELQPLTATISEQDWRLIRRSLRDSGLDLVVNRLGSPLSFAIYKHYLSESPDKKNDPIILRLWLLALGGSLYEAVSQNELTLNVDREAFLESGYNYFSNLPAGYLREMGLGLLYSISCYLSPDDQQSINLKRSIGQSISEGQRTSIENRVSKNKARIEHTNKPGQ